MSTRFLDADLEATESCRSEKLYQEDPSGRRTLRCHSKDNMSF